MRQHQTDRLAVHDVKARRERIGTGVSRAQHRVFDGGARAKRAKLHTAPSVNGGGAGKHRRDATASQPPRPPAHHSRPHPQDTTCGD